MTSLSLDILAISAFVWLYAFNPDSAIWAALYLLPCVRWPPDSSDDGDFDRVEPVVYQGEVVGDISVTKESGQPLSESEEQLLAGLASQAGLALRNLRLAAELEGTIEELRASRQRIVTAQDRERRRMERDIHDGAQQQLVAIAVNLNLAEQMVSDAPEAAVEIITSLKRDVGDAVETLRDLARGLFPPLLVDSGLAAALRAHVAKVGLDSTINVDGVTARRFGPQVETAVWFCCLEAMQNASKHAPGAPVAVRLAEEDGGLEFSVADHGPGFDLRSVERGSGLRDLADRIEAWGAAS
ncbi:MAG: hypothetical protein H0V52_11645, partial [Acidimicrobiia bacterium]|nr:hypothetical protein [Acidimicrobiia bacterium]